MSIEAEPAQLHQPLLRFAMMQLRNESIAEDVLTLSASADATCTSSRLTQSLDDAMDALFAKDGHWQDPPPAWQQPEKSLEQRQFFEALQTGVDWLPAKVGRVLMMREWLDKEVDDICTELGISASHCGVMLYRERLRLRDGLDRNWFAGQRRRSDSIARKRRGASAKGLTRPRRRQSVPSCVVSS